MGKPQTSAQAKSATHTSMPGDTQGRRETARTPPSCAQPQAPPIQYLIYFSDLAGFFAPAAIAASNCF